PALRIADTLALHDALPIYHLDAAGRALAALRKLKSEAKVSMRTLITGATLAVSEAAGPLVEPTLVDVRAAGRAADLVLGVDPGLISPDGPFAVEVRNAVLVEPEPTVKA